MNMFPYLMAEGYFQCDYDGRDEQLKKYFITQISSNMYVLATMNTADQNVFTLDTAFQRRWNMQQIENRFDTSKICAKRLYFERLFQRAGSKIQCVKVWKN